MQTNICIMSRHVGYSYTVHTYVVYTHFDISSAINSVFLLLINVRWRAHT